MLLLLLKGPSGPVYTSAPMGAGYMRAPAASSRPLQAAMVRPAAGAQTRVATGNTSRPLQPNTTR
ncbi:hypothetical protein [Rhodoferax sp. TS-BS-61-7]|uniref:hypothetical protein n=1 Tax=Rhodoferax sp. TS-BS-61-7 TaxID=2094194 RepID=UPI000CF6A782|nr:hypothetical protein [Rhodoferax sp. TS-BS-61-7]PQA78692.1 hypothetical protein C5F53_01565 [Rhodoferax sp. TS-BS-61-7]